MLSPRLEVGADSARVVLPGLAAILSLRRSIPVPYDTVAAVDVVPVSWRAPLLRWRVGTHLPGVLALGSFRGRGERAFFFLLRGRPRALEMRLRRHRRFDRLVLCTADPDADAAALRARLALGPGAYGPSSS